MGLWQRIRDAVLKPDMEVKTSDDEEAFISTSPYPKPDAEGEHDMRATEGDEPDG